MNAFPKIANYRIIKKLGEGGMAIVYEAVQEKLERVVAIKVLKSHHLKDENFAKRFLREAETAANLIHPNIVTIYDVGESDGQFYIVMEMLKTSLKDEIKQRMLDGANQKISFEESETIIESLGQFVKDDLQSDDGTFYGYKDTCEIIKNIGSALNYAHSQGFVHRDIKPDNILFRKDKTPVLVDFGIARPIEGNSGMTTEGIIIGTPHYMSPEQCHGVQIDKRSDFYSLGVVFYELLIGRVPYKADSATGILVKHIKSPVPVLPEKLRVFQPFINKIMAKDKEKRIKDNEELLTVLDPLILEFERSLNKNSNEGLDTDAWTFNDDSSEIGVDFDKEELEADASSNSLKLFFMVTFLGIVAAAYFIFIYNSSSGMSSSEIVEPIVQKNKIIEKTNDWKKTEKNLEKEKTFLKKEKIKKYIVIAEEYFSKNEYENALEKIELAKKIEYTKDIKDLEARIKQKQAEEIEKKKLADYRNLVDKANENLKNKDYKDAYENLRSAALIIETEEVKALVDKVIKEEQETIKKQNEIKRKAEEKKRKDKRAYKRAKSINEVYGYETYLKRFPKGRYVKEAKRRIEDLKNAIILEETTKDSIAFVEAKKRGTINSYENYIKKHRVGKFISIAKKKIDELRNKIRRETKIKFILDYIKFFNRKIGRPGPKSLRKYTSVFETGKANYIFAEIKLLNKFYKIDDFKIKIFVEYKNNKANFIYRTNVKNILQRKDNSNFIYTTGMGWKEKGKWKRGKYIISIYMDGKPIGRNSFIIK